MSGCDDVAGIVVARDVSAATPFADGAADVVPIRGGRHREAYVLPVLPDLKVAADEGSVFTGINPTIGTGVAGPNAAAFNATSAVLFALTNKGAASGVGGPRSMLAWLRLILTAIPTAGVSFDLAILTDTVARASAGTAVTLANANTDANSNSPSSVLLYTPTVAAASPNVAQKARIKVKGATPVAGDEYLLVFGSVEQAGALVASSTVAGRYVIPCPPVIVGPGGAQTALIYLWSTTSSAAPSFEFEAGVIER